MSLPYDRKFNIGRQSEMLLDEERHKLYESLCHINEDLDGKQATPAAKINGALWIDKENNELKTYDKKNQRWKPLFEDKFRVFDEMTSEMTPQNPVKGQFWLFNEVLMYYDGSGWKPVQTLEHSDSQFNISSFEDFVLVSPLNKIGSTVVDDEEIERYIENEKKYFQGKLDYDTNSSITKNNESYRIDQATKDNTQVLKPLELTGSRQYLVPNIGVDRVFVDDKLDLNYDIKNKTCITYPKSYMLRKDSSGHTVKRIPSLVHINPGKISSITKRLVKIDRRNPRIGISAVDTEFYGYRKGEVGGHFLIPVQDGASGSQIDETEGYATIHTDEDKVTGDYRILSDSIYLMHDASETYDYILAVTFDFSWIKSTGQMRLGTNKSNKTSYYIPGAMSPLDIFVQGYNLEEPYYEADKLNNVLTIDDNTTDMEVSLLHSVKHEFGFVNQVDLEGRAIIHPYNHYKQPLIFVNGEALHPMLADVEIAEDKNEIRVGGGKLDMCWSIIELENDDGFCMYADSGLVQSTYNAADGAEPAIIYNTDQIPDKAYNEPGNVVVFVDGLLIRKEDVHIRMSEGTNRYILIDGLQRNQEYILLWDKNENFYGDLDVHPATAIGSFNESLVYKNGLLLCNDTAFIMRSHSPESLIDSAANGEVKQFMNESHYENGKYVVVSSFKKFNSYTKTWEEDTNKELEHDLVGYKDGNGNQVYGIANSYTNAITAISYLVPINNKTDQIKLYCFNYASSTETPITIGNISADNEQEFEIADKKGYLVGTNSLAVWVNGVRQYEVEEQTGGMTFALPEPVTGTVTYTIQKPGKGETMTARRIVLNDSNVVPGCANIYTTKDLSKEDLKGSASKTDVPLYPGRVAIYIDGIRQPKEAFTIIDNYTFYINDSSTILVGANNNYPVTRAFDSHNDVHDINYVVTDKIYTDDISWTDKPKYVNGQTNEDVARQIGKTETKETKDGDKYTEWNPEKQPNPLVISPDRIMVEVKYDYERTENTFEPDPGSKYEVNLDHYGLPLAMLDTNDEIMIFLDGLFFGLKNNEGYSKDKLSGSLIFKNQDFINSIIGDPLENYLQAHALDERDKNPNIIYAEQLEEFRKSRPEKLHTITLEWR